MRGEITHGIQGVFRLLRKKKLKSESAKGLLRSVKKFFGLTVSFERNPAEQGRRKGGKDPSRFYSRRFDSQQQRTVPPLRRRECRIIKRFPRRDVLLPSSVRLEKEPAPVSRGGVLHSLSGKNC